MAYPSFLLQFQEEFPVSSTDPALESATGTGTRVREEPDQDFSTVLLGTQTITAAREEGDQDRSGLNYFAIPR